MKKSIIKLSLFVCIALFGFSVLPQSADAISTYSRVKYYSTSMQTFEETAGYRWVLAGDNAGNIYAARESNGGWVGAGWSVGWKDYNFSFYHGD